MTNQPKPNEIETILEKKLLEIESHVNRIRGSLAVSRATPVDEALSYMIYQYSQLCKASDQLHMAAHSLEELVR